MDRASWPAAALLSILALQSCSHAGPAPVKPAGDPTGVAAFTAFSRFVDAKISSNGTYLAAIRIDEGKRSLGFIDLVTRKLVSVYRPLPQSVGRFFWLSDDFVAVEVWDERGTLAAPVYLGAIYRVSARGGGGRRFASGTVVRAKLGGERRWVLIASPGNHVIYFDKKNIHTGHSTRVSALDTEKAQFFLTDDEGEPRIAEDMGPDWRPRYLYREPGQAWSHLDEMRGFGPASTAVGFVGGRRTVDVVEPLAKGFGLYSVNVDSGERTLLSKNDWVPPNQYLRDEKTQQILAVGYDPDLSSYDFLVADHPLSRALKGLLAAYPDENVRILNATDDEKLAVAYVDSDRDPGRFLLVDTQTSSAEEIVAVRPWIKTDGMAEMTAFHFPASDGLWIHGYVTLPKLLPESAAPPMVVIPHGGPHGVRDRWSFDPEVQLLASQGYAVLQVNYRGSGGYGRSFQEAGYGHWGDRIVEDILDTTRYAVRKGYADPQRICIYGGSFGAYAAMQSAIVAPDLFRCAVGVAGIYDLTLMAKEGDIPETKLGRGFVRTAVGEDQSVLKKVSPVYNADKLKARVLLIHGKQDRRAPIEHAERLRDALTAAGAPPQWLVEPHEAHGFYDEGARERMYTLVLQFLRDNTQRVAR
jgi:acetyl esterase/lipase